MADMNRRKGVTTVETAIVLSLLVFPITFGMIEYGWMFHNDQQITNAARQAARLAALPDTTTQEVIDTVSSLMSDAGMAGTGYTVSITPSDITSPESGDSVTVAIAVPSGPLRLTSFPLPMPASLGASVTMAKEGP
jgi:Flp pilus assembly protein TadG